MGFALIVEGWLELVGDDQSVALLLERDIQNVGDECDADACETVEQFIVLFLVTSRFDISQHHQLLECLPRNIGQ